MLGGICRVGFRGLKAQGLAGQGLGFDKFRVSSVLQLLGVMP